MGFQGQFYTNMVQGLRMPPAFAPFLISVADVLFLMDFQSCVCEAR